MDIRAAVFWFEPWLIAKTNRRAATFEQPTVTGIEVAVRNKFMQPATEPSRLRYLNASQVESPVGQLRDMVFRSPTDEEVGKLDGIIIDPLERRVCYYVVQSGNWLRRSRYLLPAVPAPIEPDRKALRVDLEPDALQQCPRFQKAAFRPFSDDDLIEAMFPSHVA